MNDAKRTPVEPPDREPGSTGQAAHSAWRIAYDVKCKAQGFVVP
jgi:hypothetical protein